MLPEAPSLVIAHLYPSLMNLYGDRGNIICLRERCLRRGIGIQVRELGLGDELEPDDCDLLFMGGGQDREQRLVGEDLVKVKGEVVRRAIEEGVVALAVCGGYQLFGHYYRPAQGPELKGIGIFDAWTIHKGPEAPRLIGNVVARWDEGLLVGFENHGGRTYLGPGAKPLARVLRGYGNNGEDGGEGAIYKNAFGTYLHGALLPKNPRFADYLIGLALERKYGYAPLPPLDDGLEKLAHRGAIRRTWGEGWGRLLSFWRR